MQNAGSDLVALKIRAGTDDGEFGFRCFGVEFKVVCDFAIVAMEVLAGSVVNYATHDTTVEEVEYEHGFAFVGDVSRAGCDGELAGSVSGSSIQLCL